MQQNLFNNGKCDKAARAAIRISFHDAIGYSRSLWSSGYYGGGGADGSIVQFAEIEAKNRFNQGFQDTIQALKFMADRHSVSYGDIVQFAGAVATSNCPGAPRLQFLAGRPAAAHPSPPGLISSSADGVDQMLERMEDAGFSANELVALLASHSVGTQKSVDPSVPGLSLDSTPGVFDNQFFVDTLLRGTVFPGQATIPGEAQSFSNHTFRLRTDHQLARDPRTACAWQIFANDADAMKGAYRAAMIKVATLGQAVDSMHDCSHVIPIPAAWSRSPILPEGKMMEDLEHHCPDIAQTML